MKLRLPIRVAASFFAIALFGCASVPGRPGPDDVPVTPNEITDFKILYADNCSGCHGSDGNGGAAIALNNPVYLAIADDAIVKRVTSNGIPRTSMPAFAQSAGGTLTQKQIDVIVNSIRERWSKPDVLRGVTPPPYSAAMPGNTSHGAEVYSMYCSSCHGPEGRGQKASSIVDGSFLALLSDQELRTIVIVGRPELGAPDWRGNVPGKPMSAQDISDVVAWLASHRPKFPGQPYPNVAKSTGAVR
jgi:mono/diheme cytochrome c family protein